MSATISSLDIFQKWLKAETYVTDFRPVELQEMIKIGCTIYDRDLKPLRKLPLDDIFVNDHDQDNIGQLAIETLIEGNSVLIFCASKDWCERLCLYLAHLIHNLQKSNRPEAAILNRIISKQLIDEVKNQLKNNCTGLDTDMEKYITYGCVYHHSGKKNQKNLNISRYYTLHIRRRIGLNSSPFDCEKNRITFKSTV